MNAGSACDTTMFEPLTAKEALSIFVVPTFVVSSMHAFGGLTNVTEAPVAWYLGNLALSSFSRAALQSGKYFSRSVDALS